MQALTRRIRLLEEDYETTENRLQSASEKLEEASKAADESERYVELLLYFQFTKLAYCHSKDIDLSKVLYTD